MIKRFIGALAISVIVSSCSGKKGNMIVKGQIKGLKKGKLYLQKMKDTTIISVDSIDLFGNEKFVLSDNIDSPVMYFLTFDSNSNQKKLMFFGEKGQIEINDKVEEFGFKPIITGSKNQDIMTKFNEINHQFKMKRLNFIAKDIEARAKKDTLEIIKLERDYKKMVRRRFLYTTNFAVNHNDSEAAPYIALSELFDANIYLLDTINKSLTDKVKNSTYGKRLNKFVTSVKAKESKK